MKHEEQQVNPADAMLTPEEKTTLRLALICRMREHDTASSVFAQGAFLSLLRTVAIGIAGIASFGMGLSYAAEGALPGDMLYPIKIEMNERVRTWAAVSQEAQAEWSVVRTTRRLEELEQLAVAGTLDKKISDEITLRLEQNTDEANKAIASLKKGRIDVAAGTSSRLESSLRIHERTLIQVAETRVDVSSQIDAILEMVREKTKHVSAIRKEIEKELAGVIASTTLLNAGAKDIENTPESLLVPTDATSTPGKFSTPF